MKTVGFIKHEGKQYLIQKRGPQLCADADPIEKYPRDMQEKARNLMKKKVYC